MLTSFDRDPLRLKDLPEDTAEFFMKAPSNSVLEYVLSAKSALVEGDAEYILMEEFYRRSTGEELAGSDISVISVGGLSFPRYLDIAKLLGIRTAVVTDNDKNAEANCVARYEDYADLENIRVYYDPDNGRSTFEICMYQDNTDLCDELFAAGRKTLTVQDYMLKNKSRAAFEIAKKKPGEIDVPKYINDAITWLRH
jgi:predicted ATP-dependent endonuclease of OLD family